MKTIMDSESTSAASAAASAAAPSVPAASTPAAAFGDGFRNFQGFYPPLQGGRVTKTSFQRAYSLGKRLKMLEARIEMLGQRQLNVWNCRSTHRVKYEPRILGLDLTVKIVKGLGCLNRQLEMEEGNTAKLDAIEAKLDKLNEKLFNSHFLFSETILNWSRNYNVVTKKFGSFKTNLERDVELKTLLQQATRQRKEREIAHNLMLVTSSDDE